VTTPLKTLTQMRRQGPRCPQCRHVVSRLVAAFVVDTGDTILRRRRCVGCDATFSTVETVAADVITPSVSPAPARPSGPLYYSTPTPKSEATQ